jgi:hypothetical protein
LPIPPTPFASNPLCDFSAPFQCSAAQWREYRGVAPDTLFDNPPSCQWLPAQSLLGPGGVQPLYRF